MPNWCSNSVTIEATDSESLKQLQNAVNEEKELFNQFVPQPKFEGSDDWYMWNVENWGTKWDAQPFNIHWENNKVSFTMDTAWGPPIKFYEAMEAQGFNVTAYYWEEGMAFLGKYEDGYDEYIEYGDMSADDMENELPSWVDEKFGLIDRAREEEEIQKEEEWKDYLDSLEKTEWFPKKIKPVREGKYEVKTKGYDYITMCDWDGTKWSRWEGDNIKVSEWRGITEEQQMDLMVDELNKMELV
jgi:hypothetical protein